MAIHEKISAFLISAFDCPFTKENGSATFAQLTTLSIWFKIIPSLKTEDEVVPYEACADRMYYLVYNGGEESLSQWWRTFWSIVGTKYPNIALKHMPQLLEYTIDHKQFNLVALLPVSSN
jgi:hypothetical protein